MRRVLLIILIIAAIPIYSWDIYLIVNRFFTGNPRNASLQLEHTKLNYLVAVRKVKFIDSQRNPFLPENTNPQKSSVSNVTQQKTKKASDAQPVQPPSISITGIMWNASNPVAMVKLPDGTSMTVKEKQKEGDIEIKKIEKDRISVLYKNKQFWIVR
jgi:glucose/arabinose dehydrogenase